MLEIINLVQSWAGGAAQQWPGTGPSRSRPLAGAPPKGPLVKSGNATAVRDYVDHLATGGYA